MRPLADGSSTVTGCRNSCGLAIAFHVSKKACRVGTGHWKSVARSGRVIHLSPGRELGEVAEPLLCDIEVHEKPNKLGRGKKEGGVLFHRLHLLSTNKGELAHVRGLRPSGVGQGR